MDNRIPMAGQTVAAPELDVTGNAEARSKHNRGLILVGLFKLSKATAAVLTGAAVLHLVHRDLGDEMLRLINWLPINPEGRLASSLLDHADSINSHDLRRLGLLSFVMAGLYLVEGSGLMLEKVWAEYLTVIMTAGAMPWEIYELVRRYSHFKLIVLLLNALVVLYLIYLLQKKRQSERAVA